MALKVTKTDVWVAEIDDQPGGLAACLEELAKAGANLDCVIARRQPNKAGSGVAFVTPLTGRKVRAMAGGAGFQLAKPIATLRVDGNNKPGIGARIMRAVADAGVSMRGASAMAVGRQFVCYLGFDREADAAKAAKAIRRVSA